MEGFVVIADSSVKEIARALIKCRGIFGVLLVQNAVAFFLVCAVAVYDGDTQFFRRISRHLTLELIVIELGSRYT